VSDATEVVRRPDVCSLRERIVAEAIALTTSSGWSAVTMSRLAERVGVSRQTIYNEVGAKPELADAMVLTELGHFLDVVNAAFDAHPRSAHAAVESAVEHVLERALTNGLLRSIVSATQGVDTELLPALTTRSESVVEVAALVVQGRLAPFATEVSARQLAVIADVVVRTVLSHAMRPSANPDAIARDVAWLVGRLLSAPGLPERTRRTDH
jgi:AcrR family transcriptional regulator